MTITRIQLLTKSFHWWSITKWCTPIFNCVWEIPYLLILWDQWWVYMTLLFLIILYAKIFFNCLFFIAELCIVSLDFCENWLSLNSFNQKWRENEYSYCCCYCCWSNSTFFYCYHHFCCQVAFFVKSSCLYAIYFWSVNHNLKLYATQ